MYGRKLKFRVLACLSLAAILTTPQLGFAWNDTGHKVVARIAWDHMTPQARQKAIALLLAAPEDSGIALLFPYDSRLAPVKQRDFFAVMSTWADIVRDRNAPVRQAKYSKSIWHYTDFYWKQENGVAVDVTSLHPDAVNIVERLRFFTAAMRDPAVSQADKGVYVAWMLHLIGDLHQPLHCSARVTDTEPQGDQGGNLFELTPVGTARENRKALHGYWDEILNLHYQRATDDCDQVFISKLAAHISSKQPRSKFPADLKLGQYDAWANEGFLSAKASLYPAYLQRNVMPGKQYEKNAYAISERAIALAGYRLAQTLNELLAD